MILKIAALLVYKFDEIGKKMYSRATISHKRSAIWVSSLDDSAVYQQL
jgi:hypothetical protein